MEACCFGNAILYYGQGLRSEGHFRWIELFVESVARSED